MKYLKIGLLVMLTLGFSVQGYSVHQNLKKRDIIAERLENPPHFKVGEAFHKASSSHKKPKKFDELKQEAPKKKQPEKRDKKEKDLVGSSEGKREQEKKEKSKKEKRVGSSPLEKEQGSRKYFLPEPPEPLPMELSLEQDLQIDRCIQKGKTKEALNAYRQTGARLKVAEQQGMDVLDTRGVSKGTAGVQLLCYLELKENKKPFIVITEERSGLDRAIRNELGHLWISQRGNQIEISFKGSVLAKREKKHLKRDFDPESLKQMICFTCTRGQNTPA